MVRNFRVFMAPITPPEGKPPWKDGDDDDGGGNDGGGTGNDPGGDDSKPNE